MAAVYVVSESPSRVRAFRGAVFGNMLVLLVQFLLGMDANLFVKVPGHHPASNAANYFGGVAHVIPWAIGDGALGLLRIHVVLGLLLVLGSLSLVFQAARLAERSWLIWAIVGALGVIGAGFNGASFLIYHHDFSSMLMAAGFALAVFAYAVLSYIVPAEGRH
ncbi:MAG TPA: hypothetical protein VFB58_05930 [Chloroflexota bacterium]|nr:hypothetical protein [Chloroflexota bacterium]